MMGKAVATIVAALALAAPALAEDKPAAAKLSLTRLDCGTVRVNRLNAFSDTEAYPGQSRDLTVGCYLIRHGDQLMLWDLGLAAALKGAAFDAKSDMSATVHNTLVEQLSELGVEADDIDVVAVSHFHFDHIGQLPDFPGAKLYIGKGDWDWLTATERAGSANSKPFARWIDGGGAVEPVAHDKDIFGDGRVMMLAMPGHTPGHHTLLVRLAGMGPVLLSGDQAHFQENYDNDGVPPFNTDRADTLASFDRFKRLAKNLGATVIIQHEPRDVGKLPAFPEAAE